ncbi:MAG TPA: hypothetical protein VGD78_22430 [Chthoniobacterales bacterium]
MNRPYLPFSLLAVAAIVFLFFEYQTLSAQYNTYQAARANNQTKHEELDQRAETLRTLRADLPYYQEAFDRLLGGYTDAPLDPSQFGAVYALNPSIKVLDAGKKVGAQPVAAAGARLPNGQLTWNYELSSTAVEFHRFMPALADLENSLPLLRFTKLTVASPQEPFFNEATALTITGTFTTLREGAVPPVKELR